MDRKLVVILLGILGVLISCWLLIKDDSGESPSVQRQDASHSQGSLAEAGRGIIDDGAQAVDLLVPKGAAGSAGLGTIRGSVKGERGNNCGVLVQAESGDQTFHSLDSDGAFALFNLMPGRWLLLAIPEQVPENEIDLKEQPNAASVSLGRGATETVGLVLSTARKLRFSLTNEGVNVCKIQFRRLDPALDVPSRELVAFGSGAFICWLPQSTVGVAISAEGFGLLSVDVSREGVSDLGVLTLIPLFKIVIEVRSPAGAPVAEAQVRVAEERSWTFMNREVFSDSEHLWDCVSKQSLFCDNGGQCVAEVSAPCEVQVIAGAAGYGAQSVVFAVDGSEEAGTVFGVSLVEAGTVTSRVIVPDWIEKSQPQASSAIFLLKKARGHEYELDNSISRDDFDRFAEIKIPVEIGTTKTARDIPVGEYLAALFVGGRKSNTLECTIASGLVTGLDFEWALPSRVFGSLRNEQGEALANAQIWLSPSPQIFLGSEGECQAGRCDAQGNYAFSGVLAGEYFLLVESDAFYYQTELLGYRLYGLKRNERRVTVGEGESAQKDVVISSTKPAIFTGRVTLNGEPAFESVSIRDAVIINQPVESDGTFVAGRLAPGTHDLELTLDKDGRTFRYLKEVVIDHDATSDFAYDFVGVRGFVKIFGGAAIIEDTRVNLKRNDGTTWLYDAQPDADGMIRLPPVPYGEYSVSAVHSSFAPAEKWLVVGPDRPLECELNISEIGGVVNARVSVSGGRRYPTVIYRLMDGAGHVYLARYGSSKTEAYGTATLTGSGFVFCKVTSVPSGSYFLTAAAEDFLAVRREVVVGSGSEESLDMTLQPHPAVKMIIEGVDPVELNGRLLIEVGGRVHEAYTIAELSGLVTEIDEGIAISAKGKRLRLPEGLVTLSYELNGRILARGQLDTTTFGSSELVVKLKRVE